MAAAPTFVHVDKSIAVWTGTDGVPCIIYPDKLEAAMLVSFHEERLGDDPYTYSANAAKGTNILFYTRSIGDSLDIESAGSTVVRAPCVYYDPDADTTTIISNAKFPRISFSLAAAG